jgi:hypothetical protein
MSTFHRRPLAASRLLASRGREGAPLTASWCINGFVSLGWRAIFVLIVGYVTLDLSLPAMPGAFVFEPAKCVESVQTSGGREASEVEPTVPPLQGGPGVVHIPLRISIGSSPIKDIQRPSARVMSRLPRAMLAPASPSDDPQ